MTFRIHGDNIIECERTLHLITSAYQARSFRKSNSIYAPCFEIRKGTNILFNIDILAGHDRWGIIIGDVIAKSGVPLRESTDAYITKISADGKTEEIVFAVEFYNALPAGNNAW